MNDNKHPLKKNYTVNLGTKPIDLLFKWS